MKKTYRSLRSAGGAHFRTAVPAEKAGVFLSLTGLPPRFGGVRDQCGLVRLLGRFKGHHHPAKDEVGLTQHGDETQRDLAVHRAAHLAQQQQQKGGEQATHHAILVGQLLVSALGDRVDERHR